MIFTFEPTNDKTFKRDAVNHTIETVVLNSLTGEEITSFIRNVKKIWDQTCENNIATDHRIKILKQDLYSQNYIVHTRIL